MPCFFETLWYHRVVSGFFGLDRLNDVLNSYFIMEAGKGVFCYIKRKTGYLRSPDGLQYKHPITKKLRKRVLDHYGYRCHFCGTKLSGNSSDTNIHHLIPELLGGETSLKNLRPVCLNCHAKLGVGIQYWKKPKL